ncbi:MAG: alpha-mannosidase [Clostridia bacterium]|nr:alpha-mannosidase [Clostridia bacterium]
MSILDTRISKLKGVPGGKASERLMYEIKYARRVSNVLGGKYDDLILKAIDCIEVACAADGVLTDRSAAEAEQMLLPMQADCKKYKLMLCGHAHIDMNWMWRYDETVQITIDTFATVLKLMREFPEFTFSQSQASVYRIMEENAPDMLEEIRKRAQEGRWEVSASTWVEADRNMSSAEAVARHHLYTLNYLPKLLGIDRPQVDFEPDTFGHHRNTPELLSQAGIKYYYHCRGLDGQTLYKWRAPSGAEVLVYREPYWYNDTVKGDMAEFVPDFCEQFGVESALRVYGVGDHGGGPTRRDLNRIVEMQTWPTFPVIEFGTYARFFEQAARATKDIPVVDQELNSIFVGCYTTQTRIKKGNRYSERMLSEAEGVNAIAHAVAKTPYRHARFEAGWRNVLFNQFHDILPGSGVTDTREYAMGLYQEAYAVANSAKRLSMKAIADRIDTSMVPAAPFAEDVSTGAGVGFKVEESLDPAPVEAGQGATRIYHLFNACAFDRTEVTELTVWDYSKDLGEMEVTDVYGRPVEHQIVEQGYNTYWGHDYTRVYVRTTVPAMGYQTVVVRPKEDVDTPVSFIHYEGVEQDDLWTLENDLITVECDPAVHKGSLIITEKATGEVVIADGFRYVVEDSSRGMTAWVTGDPISDERLSAISMKRTVQGELYNELTASVDVGQQSRMTYKIGLSKGSRDVVISAEVHWLENSDRDKKRVPQLRFMVMADDCARSEYAYDVPGGWVKRGVSQQEQPGIRYIAGGRVLLMTDSKYGYRGDVGQMGVTLIRSSYDPDPYPELGVHRFKLAVGLTDDECAMARAKRASAFASAITPVSGEHHEGSLAAEKSFIRVRKGSAEIQSVKLSEDGRALIIRGVAPCQSDLDIEIELGVGVKKAYLTDTLEEKTGDAVAYENGTLSFTARAWGMFTIYAEL